MKYIDTNVARQRILSLIKNNYNMKIETEQPKEPLIDELNNKKLTEDVMNKIYQKYRSLGKWECSRKCMAAILKTQAGRVLKLEPTRC